MKVTKESRIFVSFKEINEYQVRPGKYSTAKINWDKNKEEYVTTSHSQTLEEPITIAPTRSLTLGFPFIERALNLDDKGKSRKPKPPKGNINRWLRTPEGQLFQNWNRSSYKDKIKVALKELAYELKSEIIDFELIE